MMMSRPTLYSLFFLILMSVRSNGFVISKGVENCNLFISSTSNQPTATTFTSSSRIEKRKTARIILSPLQAKKNKNDISTAENKDEEKKKLSPGTYIIAPFVFLFGLDIVLNILVVTKRSLEVALTGEYTVWTPWQ